MFDITSERMDGCNCWLNKLPSMKEWIAQADPPKEASMVEKNKCMIAIALFK